MKRLLFGMMLLMVVPLTARAQKRWERVGAMQVKRYELQGFTGVNNTLCGDVEVMQGDAFSVVGESRYGGLLDDLRLEVRDGVLHIGSEQGVREAMSKLSSSPFTLRITMPRVTIFRLSGNGDMHLVSDVQTERLSLLLAGNGDMSVRGITSAGRVEMALMGNGDMSVRGVTSGGKVEMRLQGNGDMKVGSVGAAEVEIKLQGNGDIETGDIQSGGGVVLGLQGNGDMEVGRVQSGSMTLGLSGSGDIVVASVEARGVNVSSQANGDVAIRGGASERADVQLVGSGDIEMSKHRTRSAGVKVMGLGDLHMHVTGEASVRRSSISSSVRIEGGGKVMLEGASVRRSRRAGPWWL